VAETKIADTKFKARPKAAVDGPAKFESFAHVSVPCRDLEEGKRFHGRVLGGEIQVDTPTFASFRLAGVDIGTDGCTWIEPSTEYHHFAFFVGPDELAHMRRWLGRCGIPTSNLRTRQGVEALMFFRDPSGNVIELYCRQGYAGAKDLPKGPPRGHGTAVNIDALTYTSWSLPNS
jgi:catechol 2,3-dioxygenase-like lactoylglutathione lyase family enzyme